MPDPQRSAPARILIVDDEDEIAELMADILASDGYRTVTCSSGREALECLADTEVDLILCDLIMPELDGPGFFRELGLRRPELTTRIIFVTGDTLGEMARRFLAETDRPVIEKPFLPEDIRRAVREAIAARQSPVTGQPR
jgi:CheY-like chemotaxis protein